MSSIVESWAWQKFFNFLDGIRRGTLSYNYAIERKRFNLVIEAAKYLSAFVIFLGIINLLGASLFVPIYPTLDHFTAISVSYVGVYFVILGALSLYIAAKAKLYPKFVWFISVLVFLILVANLFIQIKEKNYCANISLYSEMFRFVKPCLSPATNLTLLFTNFCLIVLLSKKRFLMPWFHTLSLISLFIPLIYISNRIFDATALDKVYFYDSMNIFDAISLVFVVITIICLKPNQGCLGIILGRYDGSAMVRRMLPATVFVPLILCWLALQASRLNIYGPNFRFSLIAVVTMASLTGMLLVHGRLINNMARKREWYIADLRRTTHKLKETAIARDCLIENLKDKNATLANLADQKEKLIEALNVKNQEIQTFSYSISHDLNSPIASLLNICQFIIKDVNEDDYDNILDDLNKIRKISEDLQLRSDDIMTITVAGLSVKSITKVNLFKACSDISNMLFSKIEAKNVVLHLNFSKDIYFCASQTRFLQLMQNIIENSIKYSCDNKPVIIIEAREMPCETICFIKDNGKGIEKHYHHRVFELFKRANLDGGGRGIGLAVCKRIVQAHGGRIWIESSEIGVGTTFAFALPKTF